MQKQLNTLAIINPISGNGKQKHIEFLLKNHLDHSRFLLKISKTKYAGHAIEIAKNAIENNFDLVIAIGGDGTINEIANALRFSNVAMAIIPCGSGNGLARHLNIPMNVKKAIQHLNKANINLMDTASINKHHFVNVAGIGFDALIAHEFANMKKRGFSSYVKAVLTCFRTFKNETFSIEGKEIKTIENAMMLCFANSSQFGNNAYIAPKASIHDGKLNITLVKKPKWYEIPGFTLKVFTKKINKSPLYKEIIAEELTIQQNSTIAHIDGEPISPGKMLHLKVHPNTLKILY
jgi:YegS/Rv2252/BmrU family lipid kinase